MQDIKTSNKLLCKYIENENLTVSVWPVIEGVKEDFKQNKAMADNKMILCLCVHHGGIQKGILSLFCTYIQCATGALCLKHLPGL